MNLRPVLTCCPLPREPTYDAEFQHFLRGKEIVLSAGSTPKIPGLSVEQAEAVVRLSCLPAFKDLIAKVQADEVSVLNASWPRPRKSVVRDYVCQHSRRPSDTFVSISLPQNGLCSRQHYLLSPQQFGIWLDSSSPEQTVPYLWSEEAPSSKPASGPPLCFHSGPSCKIGLCYLSERMLPKKKSPVPEISISALKLEVLIPVPLMLEDQKRPSRKALAQC